MIGFSGIHKTYFNMCKQIVLIVCIFTVISFTNAAPPSFITKCKSTDSKCIKDAATAAIPTFADGHPEYKVSTLDPLHIKSINASLNSLLFELTDVTFVGLKNCEAKKVQRDVAKSKISMTLLCSGKLDGQYVMKGSILVLPIEGNGAVHVDLNSALFNIDVDVVQKDGEDGKKHWQIKTWTHSFELKDKSNVVFENLFDGNEVLGRATRELIANNGNDIIMEIGPNVVKALVGKVLKSVNNFFKAIPYEDLSED